MKDDLKDFADMGAAAGCSILGCLLTITIPIGLLLLVMKGLKLIWNWL